MIHSQHNELRNHIDHLGLYTGNFLVGQQMHIRGPCKTRHYCLACRDCKGPENKEKITKLGIQINQHM